MIKSIEVSILELFAWYFSTPAMAGLPILLVGIWFLAQQFFNQSKSKLPGIISIICLLIAFLHWFKAKSTVTKFDTFVAHLNSPGPHVGSFSSATNWLLEPIFGFFVAPYEYRYFHQELIFAFLSAYFLNLIVVGLLEYKKTGVLVGDLSIKHLFDFGIKDRPKRSKSNELGSGDLASRDDLNRWTNPSGQNNDTILNVTDLRGSDGISHKIAQLHIPSGERNRHMLAIAKTGGGKTTKLMLPVLYNDCLDKDRSTIVIDSKPEMWRKLAQFTKQHNPDKKILLFNPLDRHRSLSWNILAKIENDTDAKLIANTVIMATDNPQSKSDSPFFRNNALAVLNAIMVGLLNDPNDILSMPRVHELVQSGMKNLGDWLEARPEAIRTSRTFVELARSGSQNADTIMSELSMRISAWDLKDIRATTAFNEIDLRCLVDEPTLFIVEFRESELEMLRPIANVVVIELLRYLTKTAESFPGTKLPRPVGFVIDEFASALGRLPDIEVKLNTLRSRNVSIVAAIQSIAQVKAKYGDDGDSVLAGFSSKICMPNLDFTDSEWASKESGQMTIRFETSSTGSNKKKVAEFFGSENTGTQEQVQQRAVLTPDEIGRPEDGRNTFFLPDTLPFQGFLTPFYKIPKMLKAITDSEKMEELKLRESPIEYFEAKEGLANSGDSATNAGGGGSTNTNGLPSGITDVRGLSTEDINKKITEVKKILDWENTTGSAKKWWEAFEKENTHQPALVLRLSEELKIRNATISEFFLSYVYSNTDNIQANLHYLDYSRLKKEEEKKKKAG